MIQRIQSIYLLAGVVLSVICLCLPIGIFQSANTITAHLYNLCSVQVVGGVNFDQWALFAVLILSASIGTYAIFAFHNRIVQARLCLFSVLLIVGWYILYFVFGKLLKGDADGVTFTPSLSAILPALSLVFYVLARRRIKADERLVRAADRIR